MHMCRYVLVGERRRWCYDSGDWNWPELGQAQCIRELRLTYSEFVLYSNSTGISYPIEDTISKLKSKSRGKQNIFMCV
jgi:hypothetical protein